MSKRGPEDLIGRSNGATLVANAMTADTLAKKAKLDSSALSLGVCFPASNSLISVPTLHHLSPSTTAALMSLSAPTQFPTSQSINGLMPAPHMASTSSNNSADIQIPVSRVIHLRNIPSDMTELELVHFCMPFGKLVNYLMLKGKNQAFVEYEDDAGAQTLVSVSNACPMAIRGRTIFCQYSTHQELKTERKGPTKNGSIFGDMGVASNLLVLGNGTSSVGPGPTAAAGLGSGSTSCTNTTASQLDISTGGTQQQPNAVLRVIIDNMIYPVTLDVLYAIFSRYGKVLRIITFNKNNTFQALVQLSEANAAQNARQTLDGQNVYNGCCTLRIDYSKLATLNVKYNNDKSRDYTNPNLPSGELTFEQQLSLVTAAAQGQLQGLNSLVPGFTFPMGTNAANAFGFPQQTLQHADALSAVSAQNNLNPFLTSLGGNLATAAAAAAVANGNSGSAAANNAALLNQTIAGLQFPQLGLLNLTSVVLVSNLNEDNVTPDALFTLFGVYGDVQRVKILFNKKDNALIQYSEAQQAQLAIQHLDKVRWHDKVIRVTASKHSNVQMPKEGQPDAGLTRDYTNSSLHRFKKPGSKNYMNIYPPSSTLHLSNIPPNITDEFLKEAFEEKGYKIKDFKFFQRDHKMALVQLEEVETAINALVEMHNFRLADNAHLRVSFAKKGMKV